MAVHSVKRARNYTDDVEFSCEDAGRTPLDNLCRIVEAAIKAGATTINIPDTVGYTTPYQFGGIITNLYERVPNIDKAIIPCTVMTIWACRSPTPLPQFRPVHVRSKEPSTALASERATAHWKK